MAKGKFTEPVTCPIPMPGSGENWDESAAATKLGGLLKTQINDGGATGEPHSTGKAKGCSPYGARTHNKG